MKNKLMQSVVVLSFIVLMVSGCEKKETPKEQSDGALVKSETGSQQAGGPIEGRDWIVPDIGMEFVWIPSMKSWVGKYEVTNGEYRKFKLAHHSKDYNNHNLNTDRQPAVYVSYADVVSFTDWLTKKEQDAGRLVAGWHYRLPSKNEWLAYVRCGDSRLYPWGNEWPPKYGNYSDEQVPTAYKISDYKDECAVTCPVEKSGSNEWGLFGVGGNAAEWTSEWFNDEKQAYEIRGGDFRSVDQQQLRCDESRIGGMPALTNDAVGFRVLLSH